MIDEQFNKILIEIKNNTLVDKDRCSILYQFSKHTANLEGDIAEVGVYKGGTAKLISKTLINKQIHLFDTFEGMPETDPKKDKHKKGDFKIDFELVRKYLNDCNNIHIYKGFFPDTSTPIKDKKFCFVHIDADIYKSVYDSCIFFYKRLVNGAIMIFDDYGFPSCPGAKQAVDNFFLDKNEQTICLPTGQCFIIKM